MFSPLLRTNFAMMQNSNLEIFEQYSIDGKPFFIGVLHWRNVPKDCKISSEFKQDEFKCNVKTQIAENCSYKIGKLFVI